MSEVQQANRVLAARSTVRHAVAVLRAADSVEEIGREVDSWWVDLLALVRDGKPVGPLVDRLPGILKRTASSTLRGAVRDGWGDVQAQWRGAIPPGLLVWSASLREETQAEKQARLERESGLKLFDAPDPAMTEKLLRTTHWFEGGKTYEERLLGLSKKVTDAGGLASRVSSLYAAGKTPGQIEAEVRPIVQGIKTSSQRIVRTETLRISEELAREGYARADHLIAGLRVWAVLDDRTRPEHAIRNGKFYTKDGAPIVPDEPNCRCYTSPILRDPDGVLPASITGRDAPGGKVVINGNVMDVRSIAAWFDAQTFERQRVIVGVDRQNMVKNIIGKGEPHKLEMYFDAQGFMLPWQAMVNDTKEAVYARAGMVPKPKSTVAKPKPKPQLKKAKKTPSSVLSIKKAASPKPPKDGLVSVYPGVKLKGEPIPTPPGAYVPTSTKYLGANVSAKTEKMLKDLEAKKAKTATTKATLDAMTKKVAVMKADLQTALGKNVASFSTAPPAAKTAKAPAKAKQERKPPARRSPRMKTSMEYEVAQKEWIASLSKEQRFAIQRWSSSDYMLIRKHQQGGLGSGSDAVKERGKLLSDNLEAALARAPRYQAQVFRGIHLATDHPALKDLTTPGSTFTFDATSSMSTDRKIAESFAKTDKSRDGVVMSIRQKSGVRISELSEYENEKEVIAPRGTKLRVVSVKTEATEAGGRRHIVELEED